jgi:exonuclease III
MSNHNIDIISWNVRGLNSPDKCLAVHETLADNPCQIACLQETKLQLINPGLASFLGTSRLNNFVYKLAIGTKGASS